MGLYINPKNESKESWISKNCSKITQSHFDGFNKFDGEYVTVCLVDNLMFTAAGICFDEREHKAFVDSLDDGRYYDFYLTTKDKIREVVGDQKYKEYFP